MSALQSHVQIEIDSLRAIVLDFDGTIVDSIDVKTQAFFDLFLPFGEDVAIRARDYHLDHQGITRTKKIEHIVREFDLPSNELLRDRLADQFAALVLDRVVACPYLPGALEFLRHQSPRLPLFLVSATPGSELGKIVERRGISSYFTTIFGYPPDKQDALSQILRDNEFASQDVLTIGDSLSDLEASQLCQTRFIGLTTTGTTWPSGTPVVDTLGDVFLDNGLHQ